MGRHLAGTDHDSEEVCSPLITRERVQTFSRLGLENVDAMPCLSDLMSQLNAADIIVRQRRRKGGRWPVPDSSL
jgi:hypothetical protein